MGLFKRLRVVVWYVRWKLIRSSNLVLMFVLGVLREEWMLIGFEEVFVYIGVFMILY